MRGNSTSAKRTFHTGIAILKLKANGLWFNLEPRGPNPGVSAYYEKSVGLSGITRDFRRKLS